MALTAYANRLTAVDVGILAIQSRRYSFLMEAGFSGRFRPFPSRKGVAVGGDAVQEWLGTVTALERGQILAAGGDDILATEFRKTGTTLLLKDARLARFLRSPAGEFGANFALNLALAVPDLISPWQNPYYNLEQRLVQTGVTLGGVGAATGAGLWVSGVATTAALGGPATFVLVTATGIVIFITWEGVVKPAVSWTFPIIGLHDPYQEYRNLRPLGGGT